MTKNNKKKTSTKRGKTQAPVFVENINMETQTVFKEDGRIDIYPCDFELGQNIVSGNSRVTQRGRMTTMDDGTSHFMPYAESNDHRYVVIQAVKNGKLMRSESRLVLHVSVPLKGDAYHDLLETILKCVKPSGNTMNL